MSAPVGNQFAAKAREWEQSLKRAMARKADGDFRKTLDAIATTVVDKALEGEREAWMEIGNRMDGKPAQALTVAGDAENPLATKITVEYIAATGGLSIPPAATS
jgi:hypothetical protein